MDNKENLESLAKEVASLQREVVALKKTLSETSEQTGSLMEQGKLRGMTPRQAAELMLLKICDLYQIHVGQVKSKTRKQKIHGPRRIFIYLSHKHIDCSLSELGRMLGGRDHTTSIYNRDTVKDLIAVDEDYRDHVAMVEKIVLAELSGENQSAISKELKTLEASIKDFAWAKKWKNSPVTKRGKPKEVEPEDMPFAITPKEAAKLLKVTRAEVFELRNNGKIKGDAFDGQSMIFTNSCFKYLGDNKHAAA